MKLKLFDETEIIIKSIEEIDHKIVINIPLAKKSEYADIFDNITDVNLSAVTVIGDDETESKYNHLKFLSAELVSGGKYSINLVLSNKTEFEMKVTELEEELTRTQAALVEMYETVVGA